jgi:hypothetical protein
MNELGLAMLGAMARTTAVGLLAVLLVAWLSRRHRPESAAMAAHAGLLGLLLTAGLSLAPWPQAWILRYPLLSNPTHAPPLRAVRRSPMPVVTKAVSAGREIPVKESMSARTIKRESTNISKASRVAPPSPSPGAQSPVPSGSMTTERPAVFPGSKVAPALAAWPAWLLAMLAVGWTLGVLRFASGLIGLGRCVARTRVIEDSGLLEMARGLIASLKIQRPVALRESDARGLPATVGLIRPCILLPCGWRAWTEDECRVVLAHELAHIRRGDFANRLAGCFCVIVHFYHPIAHWLMARMRFEQELAADSWAIRLAGGRTKYLTTLARIALRHDAGRARGFDRSLLAFDGSFLRRIDVLDRDMALERETEPNSTRTRWMTLGVLGFVAVLAAALRAPLAPAADQALPAVSDPAALAQRDAEVPFDLSRVPAEAVGVFAFRPSSLVGNEAIQSLLNLLQSSDDFRHRFAQAASMGLAPESIEQVIYVQFKADLETVLKDELSVLRRGALIVKTKSSIDAKAAAKAFGEFGGKYRLALSLEDRMAIVGDEAAVKQISSRKPGSATKCAWSEAWSGVERSQVAIAVDAAYVRGMTDMNAGMMELMLYAAPAAPIWEGAKSISVGLNIVGDQVEIVSLNVAATVEAAETTYQTDQALLTLARNAAGSITRQFRKMALVSNAGWEGLMIAKFADLYSRQILQHTRVERTGHSVRFATQVDIDTLFIMAELR